MGNMEEAVGWKVVNTVATKEKDFVEVVAERRGDRMVSVEGFELL